MKKKNTIDQFISSLIEFKADDTLRLQRSSNELKSSYKMAAAGGTSQPFQKIASLSNSDESVLVRVFKNVSDNKYDLYFLSDDDRFNHYPILFEPETFKYFIIREDGHAEIPASSDIDPLTQPLALSYPIATETIDLQLSGNTMGNIFSHMVVSDKLVIKMPEIGAKALLVFSSFSEIIIVRLVRIWNGEVTVSIPENIKTEFFVGVFK